VVSPLIAGVILLAAGTRPDPRRAFYAQGIVDLAEDEWALNMVGKIPPPTPQRGSLTSTVMMAHRGL
jgi:hypothetical protein